MKNIKKIKAFTLAEVLITLAIIGVVAALTIPTVVTNYQARALETQKKKVLSTVTNAIRLLMAKDGVTSIKDTKLGSCAEDRTCAENEIKRIFNVISDNNSENEIFNTDYKYAGGTIKYFNNNTKYIFISSDGAIFKFIPSNNSVLFVIDVNGSKFPNIGGEDVCYFSVFNNGQSSMNCEGAWQDR